MEVNDLEFSSAWSVLLAYAIKLGPRAIDLHARRDATSSAKHARRRVVVRFRAVRFCVQRLSAAHDQDSASCRRERRCVDPAKKLASLVQLHALSFCVNDALTW